jgi:hypothetical protein
MAIANPFGIGPKLVSAEQAVSRIRAGAMRRDVRGFIFEILPRNTSMLRLAVCATAMLCT